MPYILPSGKYKGKTIAEIYKEEEDDWYLREIIWKKTKIDQAGILLLKLELEKVMHLDSIKVLALNKIQSYGPITSCYKKIKKSLKVKYEYGDLRITDMLKIKALHTALFEEVERQFNVAQFYLAIWELLATTDEYLLFQEAKEIIQNEVK